MCYVVYVCGVCMVYEYIHKSAYAHVCVSQGSISDVLRNLSPPYFLIHRLTWTGADKVRLTSKPVCLSLAPQCWGYSTQCFAQRFAWVLGIGTRLLTLPTEPTLWPQHLLRLTQCPHLPSSGPSYAASQMLKRLLEYLNLLHPSTGRQRQ